MNKKALFIGIGAALVIFFGYLAYQQWGDKPQLVTYKEPSLTAEARAIYEQRLSEAQKAVAEINDQTPAEEKFNRYMALGSAKFSLGFYLDAKNAYQQALEVMPNNAFAWQAQSTTLTAMGDYKGALNAIKKAISLDPKQADFWKWQIDLEKDHFQANSDRVDELYGEALSKTDNNINIITAYATFLEQTGDLEGALEQWQKAYEVNTAQREVYQAEIDRLQRRLEKLLK
ncbi:MAG: hypothetical protein HYV13_03230 [Candidatus Doudnabacteria bacterium]|nr:hypothetical protein [Candidatus Doudnabacteria bacterium]